jgi:hypothetical protein
MIQNFEANISIKITQKQENKKIKKEEIPPS